MTTTYREQEQEPEAELAESWINGNRSYVVKEILRIKRKADAIAMAMAVLNELMSLSDEDTDHYSSFLNRMMELD